MSLQKSSAHILANLPFPLLLRTRDRLVGACHHRDQQIKLHETDGQLEKEKEHLANARHKRIDASDVGQFPGLKLAQGQEVTRISRRHSPTVVQFAVEQRELVDRGQEKTNTRLQRFLHDVRIADVGVIRELLELLRRFVTRPLAGQEDQVER